MTAKRRGNQREPVNVKDGNYRCKKCSAKVRNKKYFTSERGSNIAKQYRKDNAEKARKRAKDWAKANPKRRREIEKKYTQSKKGRVSAKKRSRKAYWKDPEYQRQRALERIHGTYQLDDKCAWCGVTEDLTQDHMHPRARGGSNSPDNLWTLCRPCNSFKNSRLVTPGLGVLI